MPYTKACDISMGLPITESRARELAETIAQNSNAETVDALVELLLGIAPAYRDVRDFPEDDLANFQNDLECRGIAASFALATLFETSDIFLEAFRRYTEQYMPKQSLETMTNVFRFDEGVARELISEHVPDRGQVATPKAKRASKSKGGRR